METRSIAVVLAVGVCFGAGAGAQPSDQPDADQNAVTPPGGVKIDGDGSPHAATDSSGSGSDKPGDRISFFSGMNEPIGDTSYDSARWQARIFKPSTRIYFDVGNDAPGNEPDIFVDGSVNVALDVVEIGYWWDLGAATSGDLEGWGFGIVGSIGIGTPAIAAESNGGDTDFSTAPVALLCLGVSLEKVMSNPTDKQGKGYLGIQVGYAQGFSTDERYDDSTDGAVYVGVSVAF